MQDCLIAIGSNLGDRQALFDAVYERLSRSDGIGEIQASTPLETIAVGGPDRQAGFLNGAIRLQCELEPQELHRQLVEIESTSGRVRRTRWGPRALDLDLLLYGRRQLELPDLIVPHPRMSFRRFVLEPALEIADDMIHPPSGQTIGQLVNRLNRARNLILCVDGNREDDCLSTMLDEIRDRTDATWDLRMVRYLKEYRELAVTAKLVTYFQESTQTDEMRPSSTEREGLIREAKTFPGPTLRLPSNLSQAEVELRAAIAAMAPSDQDQD